MANSAADRLVERLRAAGVRLTAPRLAVVESMASAGGHHLTAGDLLATLRLGDPRFHESTVYRTLDRLVEIGLVTRIDADGGPVVYHLTVTDPHHHVVCDRCGLVTGVPADLLDPVAARLSADHGFVLRADAVTLPGRCQVCPPTEAAGGSGEGGTRSVPLGRGGSPLRHQH